jgi:AhpD family alkylhydroperoxidase
MSHTVTDINVANDPRVAELVALAAAVGSNCEACFRSHYETARSVGLSTEEIVRALSVAEAVKATPARRMRELAARKLDVPVEAFSSGPAAQAEPTRAATECC